MQIDTFLARWRDAGGSVRADYQLFITDLCALLDVEPPQPSSEDTLDNAYVFERRTVIHHGDDSTSNGFIDCCRRAALIGEVKKIGAGFETRVFDDAMLRARGGAENYARHLPPEEGRPPFLVVIGVGNSSELHAEFSCTGGIHRPFPDLPSFCIPLDDPAADTDALLEGLVVLNLKRGAEEAGGHVRWLRPDVQNPSVAVDPQRQAKMELPQIPPSTATTPAQPAEKRPWPATRPEQVASIALTLAERPLPLGEAAIAACFTGNGPWNKRLGQHLEILPAHCHARAVDDRRYGASQ
jgi:hypothetical protein